MTQEDRVEAAITLKQAHRVIGDPVGLLLSVLTLSAVFLLYRSTLLDIIYICWHDDDYSHGLILPFVSLYLIKNKLPDYRRSAGAQNSPVRNRSSAMICGAMLLAAGMLLFFIGEASFSLFARWLSLFPVLIGITFLIFDARLARLLLAPILLDFMAKPIPDSLVPKLFGPFQTLAAKVSAVSLDALNVPVHLLGNIIEIPGMRLLVEEACSGMRSLMAILTVSLIVLQLVELSLFAKVLLVLFSVGVALGLNIVRVTLTGILAYFYDPASATGFFHTFSGMIVFFVGLLILYSVGWYVQRFSWARRGHRP